MELPKGAAWGRDPRAREAGGESLESLGKRKRETCLRLRPGRMTTHGDAEGLEPAYGGLGTLLLPNRIRSSVMLSRSSKCRAALPLLDDEDTFLL